LGVTRFVRFAANRGLRVRRSAADRLVAAARTALPAPEAVVARQVLADDLGLLAELDVQIAARIRPFTRYPTEQSVRPRGNQARSLRLVSKDGMPRTWLESFLSSLVRNGPRRFGRLMARIPSGFRAPHRLRISI
jgi:hypothetical protein